MEAGGWGYFNSERGWRNSGKGAGGGVGGVFQVRRQRLCRIITAVYRWGVGGGRGVLRGGGWSFSASRTLYSQNCMSCLCVVTHAL